MKSLILFALGFVLVAGNALATGTLPANQPQTGTVTYSGSTGLVTTNSFPVAYTSLPLVTAFSSSTNSSPFTVSSVTTSNFVLTVTADTTTNNTVTWVAVPGYIRLQSGTVTLTANTASTNTFPAAYSYTPKLIVSGSNVTNAPAVQSVSATTFVLKCTSACTATWFSVGTMSTAGNDTPAF